MQIKNNNIEEICAVIVTFNPDDSFSEHLKKIQQQFQSVIVVDNASSNGFINEIKEHFYDVLFITNNVNLGIASALNQGIESAIELKYEYFVTFDQDSSIDNFFIESLKKLYFELNNSEVIIGCNYWNLNKKGMAYKNKKENKGYIERKTVITSGMFISRKTFRDVGFFKDSYFIDSVDHEFCLRARSKNYKVYMNCKPLMKHSIGQVRKNKNWLSNIAFTHSADRVYYMSRNTIFTIKTYFKKEYFWALCQIIRLIIELLAIVTKRNGRTSKLLAFHNGVKDGMSGRLGQLTKLYEK